MDEVIAAYKRFSGGNPLPAAIPQVGQTVWVKHPRALMVVCSISVRTHHPSAKSSKMPSSQYCSGSDGTSNGVELNIDDDEVNINHRYLQIDCPSTRMDPTSTHTLLIRSLSERIVKRNISAVEYEMSTSVGPEEALFGFGDQVNIVIRDGEGHTGFQRIAPTSLRMMPRINKALVEGVQSQLSSTNNVISATRAFTAPLLDSEGLPGQLPDAGCENVFLWVSHGITMSEFVARQMALESTVGTGHAFEHNGPHSISFYVREREPLTSGQLEVLFTSDKKRRGLSRWMESRPDTEDLGLSSCDVITCIALAE